MEVNRSFIGRRIVKTALAAGLAYFLSGLLNSHSPIFAIIAVIITMQQTVYETIQSSITRILGTMMGLIIGGLFFTFIPSNGLTVGIGILLTMTICVRCHWDSACSIAAMAFVFFTASADQELIDGVYRMVDTIIGIGLSIIINYAFPNRIIREEFESAIDDILDEILDFMKMNMIQYNNHQIQPEKIMEKEEWIGAKFEAAKEKRYQYSNEAKYQKFSLDKIEAFDKKFEVLQRIWVHARQISFQVLEKQGVNKNIRHFFINLELELEHLIEILKDKGIEKVDKKLYVKSENLIQMILLEMEEEGMDSYHLKREEKRVITNILYDWHKMIEFLIELNETSI